MPCEQVNADSSPYGQYTFQQWNAVFGSRKILLWYSRRLQLMSTRPINCVQSTTQKLAHLIYLLGLIQLHTKVRIVYPFAIVEDSAVRHRDTQGDTRAPRKQKLYSHIWGGSNTPIMVCTVSHTDSAHSRQLEVFQTIVCHLRISHSQSPPLRWPEECRCNLISRPSCQAGTPDSIGMLSSPISNPIHKQCVSHPHKHHRLV